MCMIHLEFYKCVVDKIGERIPLDIYKWVGGWQCSTGRWCRTLWSCCKDPCSFLLGIPAQKNGEDDGDSQWWWSLTLLVMTIMRRRRMLLMSVLLLILPTMIKMFKISWCVRIVQKCSTQNWSSRRGVREAYRGSLENWIEGRDGQCDKCGGQDWRDKPTKIEEEESSFNLFLLLGLPGCWPQQQR